MEPNNEKEFADRWLDAALKQYGNAAPRAGLEHRILARVNGEQLGKKPLWHWQVALAAVTVMLLIGIGLLLNQEYARNTPIAHESETRNFQKEVKPPQTTSVLAETPRSQHVHKRKQALKTPRDAEPRLEQFPSPAPLNEQEKMLAQYVQNQRHEAVMVARARSEIEKQELARFVSEIPEQQNSE